MMQMVEHPILGRKFDQEITFYFNEQPLKAWEGQTVSAALLANGVKELGRSRKLAQARGVYCATGRCCSCFLTIDGLEHVISCTTLVQEGMVVSSNVGDPKRGK
ncbi:MULTISPECIES: (2Fe-2S)-binding protein [Virgibacillus]|uniref:(2Fe-2S)-binding protein n=1 Tax=Virgibacillus TaxID=84406 RepID=UPI0027E44C95|nr:(2Fe-2S)-binding protein [Virgibacillus salexigens]